MEGVPKRASGGALGEVAEVMVVRAEAKVVRGC